MAATEAKRQTMGSVSGKLGLVVSLLLLCGPGSLSASNEAEHAEHVASCLAAFESSAAYPRCSNWEWPDPTASVVMQITPWPFPQWPLCTIKARCFKNGLSPFSKYSWKKTSYSGKIDVIETLQVCAGQLATSTC